MRSISQYSCNRYTVAAGAVLDKEPADANYAIRAAVHASLLPREASTPDALRINLVRHATGTERSQRPRIPSAPPATLEDNQCASLEDRGAVVA